MGRIQESVLPSVPGRVLCELPECLRYAKRRMWACAAP